MTDGASGDTPTFNNRHVDAVDAFDPLAPGAYVGAIEPGAFVECFDARQKPARLARPSARHRQKRAARRSLLLSARERDGARRHEARRGDVGEMGSPRRRAGRPRLARPGQEPLDRTAAAECGLELRHPPRRPRPRVRPPQREGEFLTMGISFEFTICKAAETGKIAAKRITPTETAGYDPVTWWRFEPAVETSLEAMADRLKALALQPHAHDRDGLARAWSRSAPASSQAVGRRGDGDALRPRSGMVADRLRRCRLSPRRSAAESGSPRPRCSCAIIFCPMSSMALA